MKEIKLSDLPCPGKLDPPYSYAWFIRKDFLTALGSVENAKGEIPVPKLQAIAYTHPDDVRGLIGIARKVEARRIFEIGTFNGATAVQLHRHGFEVHSLDLPPGQEGTWHDISDEWAILPNSRNGFFAKHPPHPITLHYCDSQYFYPGPLAGTFDLVFVDGFHSAHMVENDSKLACRLLRPGGTIVWDDMHLEKEVYDVVEEWEKRFGECFILPEIDMAYWTDPCRTS